MTTLFVFIVCLAASTIGGTCGIGGGAVIKPILDATAVMDVSRVSFLSGLTVLAMSLISVYKNRKTNELSLLQSVPLGIGAAVGGIFGKKLFEAVKHAAGADNLVGVMQAVILGGLVLGTLIYVRNKARIRSRSVRSPLTGIAIGLALGASSSFLGIGGGPMNLAVLYFFYSMDTKKAAVNSILIILLSQTTSLIFNLISRSVPSFDWQILIVMVSAGALGGYLSAKFHTRLSVNQIDILFSGLLVVILLICCYNAARMLLVV